MEKDEERGSSSGSPGWMDGPLGWGPRKLFELRAFFSEVRNELKKVTWPGRDEVYSTTIIVVATTIFFGFFLWVLDIAFSQAATRILR